MRISQTLGSLSDHLGRLRWRLAPQARSRLSRGRTQPTVSRALEQPPTARRLERFKADAKDYLRRAEEPAAARINQPLASGAQAVAADGDRQFADQTALTPLLAISSGIRALVAVLILVALLPNLTLGAIFWLGVIDTPWSRLVTPAPNENLVPAPRPAMPPAVLSAPATLEATAGEDVIFPIALDGTDGVPARSIIAISGLPQGSALSSGRPYGETEWNLKSDEIGDLHLVLPSTARGEAKVTIQLVGPNGAVLTDTATELTMMAAPDAELKEARVWEEWAQARGATGIEESFTNLDGAAITSEDSVPLPSRRPAQTANDDVGTNWIKPLAFVNLREGPSPSTRVISVVAKGAKLRVIGRKSRWVQVTHPSTSESGWIYTGNVASTR